MKNIIGLFIAFLFIGSAFSQSEMVIRINHATENDFDYFTKNSDEVTAFRSGEYIDLLVSQERYMALQAEGWSMEVTQTEASNKSNLSSQKDIDGYRTYSEALDYLNQIATDFPNICKLTDIGDSHGKEYFNSGISGYQNYQHDIWMLKISDNVNDSEDEPAVFFMGAHHAREPISTEVVLGIIDHLTSKYGNDDDITNMIDNSEIYIIPMVNPDGHEVVLNQLNTWWRKTAADNNNDGVFNYVSDGPDGVDPNRNYGWNFGGDGASASPTEDTYHGPIAFSEPETAAMRDLMATHHFTSGITYHSYSELVLYPYGYSENATAPDNDALEELAIQMAESIPKITGSGHYLPQQSNDLYAASGVTDDWAYGKHGIFSYTVELGQEFIPSSSQVPTIVSDNIESALMVLNRANVQTLRGHVYDASTLEPIVAEVFIDGIDGTESFRDPYRSNSQFGAYYRLLMEGDFDVTYSAYGYIPQSFSSLQIQSDIATIKDVYLERAASSSVIGSVIDGITGENIEGAKVQFLDTPILPVFTNENGVYVLDEISVETYNINIAKEGYAPLYVERTINENQNNYSYVLLPAQAITFEDGIFEDEFSQSGNTDWTIDNVIAYEGDYSAASGNIANNQNSTTVLHATERSAGVISFFSKVSTESGYDFLKFFIDDEEQGSWSGEQDWAEHVYQVDEGVHNYKWSYAKDGGVESGSDKAWVDFIQIPPVLTTLVNAGPDQNITQLQNSILNAYAINYSSVQWTTDGDGSFENENELATIYQPGANDIVTGLVNLEVTVTGTQTISDALELNIETVTDIYSQESISFEFRPNPADQSVNIHLNNDQGGEMQIFSISGVLVLQENISSGETSKQIDISNFQNGVYLAKYFSKNGGISIKRLLVK